MGIYISIGQKGPGSILKDSSALANKLVPDTYWY